MRENVIRNRGNYRQLLCYRKAEAIYDITYFFANKFLKQPDRTIDQMVQAARSGKQNIIEGYAAGATSIEAELRLFNVAKSSLKELLADYEDYLRTRNLRQWEQDSVEFKKAQELGKEHDDTEFWMNIVATRSDETIANIAIIILHQTDYLLHRFMEKLSSRFVDEGGFREKLSRVRKSEKNKKSPNDPNASNAPILIFPTELEAARLRALRPELDIRICGIGAVETATEVARILRTERKPLLLCGIAGAYDRNLKKGDVVAVTEERFAYLSTGYDRSYLASIVVEGLPMVRSNTVSHCSQEADGAEIENMEGAALFALAHAEGVRCGEIRAISNYVGEERGEWDIDLALERLTETILNLDLECEE